MATADLFASAFGFKQLQNQHQEQKKEEENRVEGIEDNEEEERFEFEALLEKEKEELERIECLKRKAARMIEAERRRLMALEQKRQEVKWRLASIGICPAGFVWHREGSGFRCGGGLHVVSFGQLGLSSEDVDELF